ncbi:hypothetical protein OG559_30160 [Micromonospora sp. NBC_01405]|uniref:hypothetical protein n=1 Tax=Micromonospora sp. NBC_01405 TaxID=2903589 RepID=UPI003246DE54
MSTEIVAERILSAADGAGPDRAARLVFQAFVALSRTADSHQMFPLVARVQKARDASRSARTELIYCTLVGIVATRARLADGPEYLDTVVRIFDENAFGDDPVLVECALTAVMTLMRPHEARRFAPLVDALDLAPVDRARMLAMIGVGDAWAGNLVRGPACSPPSTTHPCRGRADRRCRHGGPGSSPRTRLRPRTRWRPRSAS